MTPDYSHANADTNIVYVPRAEWEAQGKRMAELTRCADKLAEASRGVKKELDIIRKREPRVALMVHIETHKELDAALREWDAAKANGA